MRAKVITVIIVCVAAAAVFYNSPLRWKLIQPRNYQQCIKAGGTNKERPYVPGQSLDIPNLPQCIWKDKVFDLEFIK